MIGPWHEIVRTGSRRPHAGWLILLTIVFSNVSVAQSKDSASEARSSQSSKRTSNANDGMSTRSNVRLSDGAELDRLIELYMAGNYEQCSAELNVLLREDNPDRLTDPGVIERGRLYYSTCALMLGNRD